MKKAMLILSLITLLNGCSQSLPKCGDDETVDLVIQIASRGENLLPERYRSSYSLNSIRTGMVYDNGSFECAARLERHLHLTGGITEKSITYTVEKTDDGKSFYVSVRGI